MSHQKRADKSNNMRNKPRISDEPEEEKGQTESLRNPPELDGVPDLSELIHLDMPNVLHNLKYRYCNMPTKFCYTQISSILLAINPYENLPIYGQDVIRQFHDAALKGRMITDRPHPYGVSARSYMRMIQRKCNQSVIVCGESGAGKTETTKLLMRYLAMTAPISTEKEMGTSIEEQIVAASPILEAYGNAKTVMNNNSSRFGKFTKLLYHVAEGSKEGHILGSSLETYLLEKSRVVCQAMNERNYHVFYFLHEGLGHNNKEYGLQTIDQFHYTNQGKVFGPMKDTERFEELQASLSMFRVNEDVQDILWKLTAGVLNLGNVDFLRSGDGYAEITKQSMRYVEMVASLWGIKASALEQRLTTQSLKVGPGKPIVKKVQFDNAVLNRDSIAKGTYENIFLWLCKRINAELFVEDDAIDVDESKSDEENGRYFIGILDVFGFENFWANSLEQFCINYTNEKLQQYFNFHVIASEQEEYRKEGVFWEPLTVPDNKDYINFVEHSKNGFIKTLDGFQNGPSKNDTEAFLQNLFKKHGQNPCIERKMKAGSGSWRGVKPQSSRRRNRGAAKFDGFMIRHFADDVTYDVSKFLMKNAESVHSDTSKMIKKSTVSLFKEINGGMSSKGRKRKKSVTAVFYSGIKKLMSSLNQTEPYFVRCINPNQTRSSTEWAEGIVEHQLRCGGLIEALRVLSLGYPTRVPYQSLYEKYHSSVTNPLIQNMKPQAFSTSLLIAFDVDANDYELGFSKIFFKPAKADVLDKIMSKAGQPLTAEQNAKITTFIVEKRKAQIMGILAVGLRIKKMIRMQRAKKEWREKGRVAAILGGSVMKHLEIARERIQQRKMKQARLLMQCQVRGYLERKHFVEQKEKVQRATKVVFEAYNAMKGRQALTLWMDTALERRRKLRAEQHALELEAAALESVAEPVSEPVMEPQVVDDDKLSLKVAAERVPDAVDTVPTEKVTTISVHFVEERKEDSDLDLQREIAAERFKQERASITSTTSSRDEDVRQQTKDQYNKLAAQNKADRIKQDLLATAAMNGNDDVVNGGLSSDDEDEYELNEEEECSDEDMESALRSFRKISAMGQLFHRHAGLRRRGKAQDRVIKVSFDHEGNPQEVSWGKGSRHIEWRDIMYISWGHWTPVFVARKNKLKAHRCLSIVGRDGKVLDLEGYNRSITELWVRGLRRMMGQSDAWSDEMAKKNLTNLKEAQDGVRRKRRDDKKRYTDIMRLQQDLFIMSTHTVFRNLEEERIWCIDQEVRDTFLPQKMWPTVLKADIPWRHWQQWLRERVTAYCRENGKLNIVERPWQTIPVPPPVVLPQPDDNERMDEPCRLQ